MFSAYRRHSVVIALALLAGAVCITVHPSARAAVLPPVAMLTAGTGWHVVSASPIGRSGALYQEWELRDSRGHEAVLYLGATASVQGMIHWTGELGYEGQGYQILRRGLSSVRLRNGTKAPVSVVSIQRLSDRELLEYAVVSPDSIAARSTDDVLHTAWDILRGGGGPYYLVRVSIAQQAGVPSSEAVASRLLTPVLTALRLYLRAEEA